MDRVGKMNIMRRSENN